MFLLQEETHWLVNTDTSTANLETVFRSVRDLIIRPNKPRLIVFLRNFLRAIRECLVEVLYWSCWPSWCACQLSEGPSREHLMEAILAEDRLPVVPAPWHIGCSQVIAVQRSRRPTNWLRLRWRITIPTSTANIYWLGPSSAWINVSDYNLMERFCDGWNEVLQMSNVKKMKLLLSNKTTAKYSYLTGTVKRWQYKTI